MFSNQREASTLTLASAFQAAERAVQAGVRTTAEDVLQIGEILGVHVTPTGAAWLAPVLPHSIIRLSSGDSGQVYVLRDQGGAHSLVVCGPGAAAGLWSIPESQRSLERLRSNLASAPYHSAQQLCAVTTRLPPLPEFVAHAIWNEFPAHPDSVRRYGNVPSPRP